MNPLNPVSASPWRSPPSAARAGPGRRRRRRRPARPPGAQGSSDGHPPLRLSNGDPAVRSHPNATRRSGYPAAIRCSGPNGDGPPDSTTARPATAPRIYPAESCRRPGPSNSHPTLRLSHGSVRRRRAGAASPARPPLSPARPPASSGPGPRRRARRARRVWRRVWRRAPRSGRPGHRVRSACHFKNRATEYAGISGVKWQVDERCGTYQH